MDFLNFPTQFARFPLDWLEAPCNTEDTFKHEVEMLNV